MSARAVTLPRLTARALMEFLRAKREQALRAMAPSEAADFETWAKIIDNHLYGDGSAEAPDTCQSAAPPRRP